MFSCPADVESKRDSDTSKGNKMAKSATREEVKGEQQVVCSATKLIRRIINNPAGLANDIEHRS